MVSERPIAAGQIGYIVETYRAEIPALDSPLIHFVVYADNRRPYLVGKAAVLTLKIVFAIVAIDITVFVFRNHLDAFLIAG